MSRVYARNLATMIALDVTAHHFIQTVKGKMQRITRVDIGDKVLVSSARRGVSCVSQTDVYIDSDVFLLDELVNYYADKIDIYRVMYNEG